MAPTFYNLRVENQTHLGLSVILIVSAALHVAGLLALGIVLGRRLAEAIACSSNVSD